MDSPGVQIFYPVSLFYGEKKILFLNKLINFGNINILWGGGIILLVDLSSIVWSLLKYLFS